MNFTTFDYIITIIILLSTIFALFKGFIKSCITFIAFILTFILAYILFPYVVLIFKKYLHNIFIINVSSIIVSYIVAALLLAFTSNKILKITENVRGGALDRSLGLAFGLVRGCIISCIVFIIIISGAKILSDDNAYIKTIKDSKSFGLLTYGSIALIDFLPEKLNNKLSKIINKNLKEIEKASASMNELTKLLPISVLSHISASDLNKLMDENISIQDKEKIVNTILNHYSQNGKDNHKITPEQLKNILLNYIKATNKKSKGYSAKDNNDLNRLIQVLE